MTPADQTQLLMVLRDVQYELGVFLETLDAKRLPRNVSMPLRRSWKRADEVETQIRRRRQESMFVEDEP